MQDLITWKRDSLSAQMLDIVLGNDITTPIAVKEFKKAGFDKVLIKTELPLSLTILFPIKT